MEKIMLKVEERSERGKGSARSLRRQGVLPAVVYSGGDSTPVKLNAKEMTKLIYSGVGEHALITMEIGREGKKVSELPVLVKEYQQDPVSEELLHVDFIQVSLKEKINLTVPLDLINKPSGVKKGGILQFRLREVEVECLPTSIPEKIDVDVESVDIGGSLHVSDLPVLEGIKYITDGSEVILSVTAPAVEEEAEAVEEAVEAEAAEPEVVKKGKEETEESQKEEK